MSDSPLDPRTDPRIGARLAAYREGHIRPSEVAEAVIARAEAVDDGAIWIGGVAREALRRQARRLDDLDPRTLPLYGIPFAIKDNLDWAGVPTTAGCPDYAYVPEQSAAVVDILLAAGAMAVGKTNLDQFATGLVGVRSPYGVPRNPFDAAFVPGGSSSGSAVAVAHGIVSFALGTDTAGSGRVPAAFCNLVGLKPTRGLLSTRGVVPACRSLDCVSVFTLSAADAARVLDVAARYDPQDPWSRRSSPALERNWVGEAFRVAVPHADQLEFFGDDDSARLFEQSVARLASIGATVEAVDCSAFLAAARLLYEGPWVAERYVAIREFLERSPDSVLPVTRAIIEQGALPTAADSFVARYRLAEFQREADRVWERGCDALCMPTAATIPRLSDVEAAPFEINTHLGHYTNFMNLLDLAAVAIPSGYRPDGLPLGVTLAAPAFHDRKLLGLADRWQRSLGGGLGATALPLVDEPWPSESRTGGVSIVVCGAHMRGLPLNHELVGRGARFLREDRTAATYRLFALAGASPAKPGLVRAASGDAGVEVAVEVWSMSEAAFGSFVAAIPPPLGIAKVELASGERVCGFTCEATGLDGAREVSRYGGWRTFLEATDESGDGKQIFVDGKGRKR